MNNSLFYTDRLSNSTEYWVDNFAKDPGEWALVFHDAAADPGTCCLLIVRPVRDGGISESVIWVQ